MCGTSELNCSGAVHCSRMHRSTQKTHYHIHRHLKRCFLLADCCSSLRRAATTLAGGILTRLRHPSTHPRSVAEIPPEWQVPATGAVKREHLLIEPCFPIFEQLICKGTHKGPPPAMYTHKQARALTTWKKST